MHYTDVPLIETYLKRSLTIQEIAAMATIIPAIDIWIDRKTDTTFKKVEPSTRLYDGGENTVDLEPCTEITSVKTVQDDGTDSYAYTQTLQFQAYPLNEDVKTEVRLRFIQGRFEGGDGRIAVTAKFSSYVDGIPQDIQTVATKIAADIIKMGIYANSNVKSEMLEGHKIEYQDPTQAVASIATNDPLVASLLANHREIFVG